MNNLKRVFPAGLVISDMRITNDGRFAVAVGSRVTISTVASGLALNLVSFPNAAVTSVGAAAIQVVDEGLKRSGVFAAPKKLGATCTVVLIFNFQPIPAGEADTQVYTVEVEEEISGRVTRIDFGVVNRLMPFAQPFEFLTEAA